MFSTIPIIGMFISFAIFTAFETIMETRSCGLVTITIPSTGMDWNIVSGTSPVPGGQSMTITSTSPQITSVQNCFTIPAITGPLQSTGEVTSSKSRFTLTASIPVVVFMGIIPPSGAASQSPLSPKAFGIEGPVTSASITATLSSLR